MTRLTSAFAALALAAGAAAPAAAEPWFEDVTATHLPAGANNSMDAEAADLDGDGDLDLVVAQEWLLNRVLFNDGQGRFREGPLPALAPAELQGGPQAPGHDSEDVSIADFDEDGVLDVVIVSEDDIRFGRSPTHEYYRGLGGGRYERVAGRLPDTEANAVAHADVDGDGRLDLLIVGAAQDRLLMGDGRGGFRDETEDRLPREASVGQDGQFFDLDGDGDLDVVLGLEGGHALWINDGQGRFTDETAARLPASGNVEARKVDAGDVDGDGDLDLYFSHVGWQGRAPADRLLLNDGEGRFADAGAARLAPDALITLDGRFADLDGDGDLDLVRTNFGPVQVLSNDGRGGFTDVTAEALPPGTEGPGIGVRVADFNGDRLPDLYLVMRGSPQTPDARDRLLLGVRRGGRARGADDAKQPRLISRR